MSQTADGHCRDPLRRSQPDASASDCGRLRHYAAGGFSLVELLMVMAMVAVVAAIAAPRYSTALSRYRVQLAAKRVAADLAFARTRATAMSTTRTVAFDLSKRAYRVVGESDPDHPDQPYTVSLADYPYRTHIDSADFAGGPSIDFDGFGNAHPGGLIVLRSGTSSATVAVDALTGEVTVK